MTLSLCVLIVLTSLTLSTDLQAQKVWEVILPAKADSELHRTVFSISCHGDVCVATTATFAPPSTPNLSQIFSSKDGGQSWTRVASELPQWDYRSGGGKRGISFEAAQQIDSLNAVIADGFSGWLAFTNDGWKTYRLDSSLAEAGSSSKGVFFANAAEGMLWKAFGFFHSTIDSGKTWKQVIFNEAASNGIACQSYGNSTFRVIDTKQRIFTTHDNWTSWDTTTIAINGPLTDTSFHVFQVVLSRTDTITILGWRWDATSSNGGSLAMAVSPDLGMTWKEVDLPRNNGIFYPSTNPIPFEWKQNMVLSGKDSVGRILRSTDWGASWKVDTVVLSTGMPYHKIYPATVSDSGRVIAAVVDNSTVFGSASLVYLKETTASVEDANRNYQYLYIQAYPNPVHSRLSLKFHGMIVGPVSTLRCRIYDVLGRTVMDLSKLAQVGSNGDFSEFDADVSDLTPGVYFVSYTLGGAEYVKQFLKY
jgi:photosystem II stability/assembly factor-like uncharacterized protein